MAVLKVYADTAIRQVIGDAWADNLMFCDISVTLTWIAGRKCQVRDCSWRGPIGAAGTHFALEHPTLDPDIWSDPWTEQVDDRRHEIGRLV